MRANAAILGAFLRRDWLEARTYRAAYLLELAAALLMITMFFYVSRVVGDSRVLAESGQRHGYFGYVIVGLALLRLGYAAMGSLANQLREEQTTGTLEAVLTSPAPTPVVIVAMAAFNLLRALGLAAAMIVAAVLLFGLRPEIAWDGAGALVVAVPAAVALFASLGIALAAATILYKKISGALSIATFGLGVLCGAYFPLAVFPAAVHTVADALPFTWAMQLIRDAILTDDVAVGRLVALTCSTALLLPLSLFLFDRAVRRAQRLGTLGQY